MLNEEVGDRDLILQLQQGDLHALGDLYDRHRQMVFRTALAITGDPDAAADLLQDVFLRLHRFISHVNPALPLEPWLYRMTANLAYTWVKRQNRWFRPLEDLAEWLIGSKKNSPSLLAERNDENSRIEKAITSLPFAQRVVVVLYYVNDLSLQEISTILEVPVGTVKSRLHYGRQALKNYFDQDNTTRPEVLYEFT